MVSNTKRIRCIDLFAGAGGLSLAAIQCGWEVVAAIEKEKHACSTYRYNLINNKRKSSTLYESDILELKPQMIDQKHFGSVGCDVILGGPPCQGFSVHRINNSGVNDPRNSLILRYFEYVSILTPMIFVMENVPGILWERHRYYLDEFYSRGEKAGYKVLNHIVLDAVDYGVPQRRKRVFILGFRNDFNIDCSNWPPQKTHGSEAECKKDSSLKPWINSRNVFEKPFPDGDENNIHMNHREEMINIFKSTPLNGGSRNQSCRILPCHQNHNGHKDVYGRIDPNKPGPTMTTACINPSKGRFVHPTEHHGITVRQAARFQTFPDDFIFKGGLMAAGIQIGNAVPIVLGKVILQAIEQMLVSTENPSNLHLKAVGEN